MKKFITRTQLIQHPDKNLNLDEVWRRLTYRISQKLNEIFDTMKACSECHTQVNNADDNDNADSDSGNVQTEEEKEDEESNDTETEDEGSNDY